MCSPGGAEDTLAMARSMLQARARPHAGIDRCVWRHAVQHRPAPGGRARRPPGDGVNLPMLLRSVCYRAEPLDALVQRAVVGGTQGVMQVAISAPQNQIRQSHDQDQHDHQQ